MADQHDDKIPGLPQRNSTEGFADGDAERFLESIRPLQRAAAAGAAVAEAARVREETLRRGASRPKGGDQPPEKTTVSEGSFWPKTWREALPLLVWGVVIFACGFEGVSSLLHGEWLQAFLGLGGMFGLTAMLIHWTRIRDNFSDVRWLMAAIMVTLVVGALSPYVEQHRWPFTWQFVTPQAPTIASIQAQLDAANKKNETLVDMNAQYRDIIQVEKDRLAGMADEAIAQKQRAEKAEQQAAAATKSLNEQIAQLQAAQLTPTVPGRRNYPDKPDAKEALENLHDVVIKGIQPAIGAFSPINTDQLERSIQSTISMHLSIPQPPGQPLLDPKEVTTGTIKSFLNNQQLVLTDENKRIGSAFTTIFDIQGKQKAITKNATLELFNLVQPTRDFDDARADLAVALDYFLKRDTLDVGIFAALKGNYTFFEQQRTQYSKQINDAIQRIAAEIAAIDTK